MENLRNYTGKETEGEIDEAMLHLSDFVSQMTDVEGYVRDDDDAAAMLLQRVKLSIPLQVDFHVKEDGSVILGSSPPLYYTETTFLPVFHQLDITIKIEKNDAGSSEQGMES